MKKEEKFLGIEVAVATLILILGFVLMIIGIIGADACSDTLREAVFNEEWGLYGSEAQKTYQVLTAQFNNILFIVSGILLILYGIKVLVIFKKSVTKEEKIKAEDDFDRQMQSIQKLYLLFEKGILTEDEYKSRKAQILQEDKVI